MYHKKRKRKGNRRKQIVLRLEEGKRVMEKESIIKREGEKVRGDIK